MNVSVSLTNYSWPDGPQAIAGALTAIARAADERPFDTLWVPDHLLQADPNSTVEAPMLEAYTTLGYLAAATSRIRLGTMVSWASIRPPALLIKAVTTLDVLSSGRAWLGVGAGYQADEAAMMGLPFDNTATRFDHLEDALRLARRMWVGDESPFIGRRHELTRPICQPAPVTGGGPPILIGGMGERRTLPLVARHGDACNLFDVPDGGATISRKLQVLARECEALGRDPAEIDRTISTRLEVGDTAATFAARCRGLASLGIDHAVVLANGPWTEDRLDVLAAAAAELK
jgi:F420-dependent oxidoreductase-like protein